MDTSLVISPRTLLSRALVRDAALSVLRPRAGAVHLHRMVLLPLPCGGASGPPMYASEMRTRTASTVGVSSITLDAGIHNCTFPSTLPLLPNLSRRRRSRFRPLWSGPPRASGSSARRDDKPSPIVQIALRLPRFDNPNSDKRATIPFRPLHARQVATLARPRLDSHVPRLSPHPRRSRTLNPVASACIRGSWRRYGYCQVRPPRPIPPALRPGTGMYIPYEPVHRGDGARSSPIHPASLADSAAHSGSLSISTSLDRHVIVIEHVSALGAPPLSDSDDDADLDSESRPTPPHSPPSSPAPPP
ncbi:hypothetical protein C8R46DRAFT_311581 [Mycena filopes]|nr:hypothetical protein C8R46DRAFT_311581 [Mycena filopes]